MVFLGCLWYLDADVKWYKGNFKWWLDFVNFLKILVEKNRFFFLEKIVKDFKNILSDFRGELNAIVSMPTKMSDAQIKEIESMLNNVLKKKVNLDFKFDPSLISGAKLQIGSLMVDDTAKAKFNKILNNL